MRAPLLASLLLVAAAAVAAPAAPSRCAGRKLTALAADASCLLAVEARAARKASAPNEAKRARCRTRLAKAFGKAEAKPPCPTQGDANTLQELADAFVADLGASLAVGVPSACQASKLKAAGKAARCQLEARAKAAKKGKPLDAGKAEACRSRLEKRFAKNERKRACSTSGDAGAVAGAIAAFAGEAASRLAPGGLGPSLDAWTYRQVHSGHVQTFGLAFADLDGDGRTDIVSGPYWYANPGGGLEGPWAQSPALPGGVHAMLALDVDGDAFPDLIAQSSSGSEVSWLEATNAAATSWSSTPVGTLPASSHAIGMQGYRVAQLESGGRPELLLSSGGGVFYFQIPADPEPGGWPRVRVSANPSDEGFGVADVDGDGDLDVAAGTAGGEVQWYRNPGDGSADWEAFPLGDASDFDFPDRFALADLNGDGRPDLVGTEENGAASGAKTVWWEQPAAPTEPGWERHLVATQGTTNSMDVADFDGDGDADIATGEHRGSLAVRIFENDGAGGFTAHTVDEGHESHLGVRPVDIDGDGDLDLVSIAYDAPGEIHLWRNDSGAEVPFRHVVIDDELPGYLDDKSVGDLDGDGLPDIVIGTDTQLVWYRAPDWEREQILPGQNFTTDMQVADVDGDGDLDLVAAEYDIERVAWYRNPRIGGGAWTAQPIRDGYRAHDLEVADMNGDGTIDVVIRGHFGPTTLFLQETPASWTAVPIPAAIASNGLALADVDADGHVDIVQNGYWLEAPADPSDGGAWQKRSLDDDWEDGEVGVATADLSGDGRLDVILAFAESSGPMVWYEAPRRSARAGLDRPSDRRSGRLRPHLQDGRRRRRRQPRRRLRGDVPVREPARRLLPQPRRRRRLDAAGALRERLAQRARRRHRRRRRPRRGRRQLAGRARRAVGEPGRGVKIGSRAGEVSPVTRGHVPCQTRSSLRD